MEIRKFKFAEGERVLCYHGHFLYEAKVVTRDIMKRKKLQYFVHYVGWNKSWDEWVPEDRVIECNERNFQKQRVLYEEHNKSAQKNRKRAWHNKTKLKGILVPMEHGGDIDNENSKFSKKSAPDEFNEKETLMKSSNEIATKNIENEKFNQLNSQKTMKENFPNEIKMGAPEDPTSGRKSEKNFSSEKESLADVDNIKENFIKIVIPMTLKKCLVEDWNILNKRGILHEVPAKKTVLDIVNQYVAFKEMILAEESKLPIKDLMNGILIYFDTVLGTKLLYEVERTQFVEVATKYSGTPFSQLYGGAHLLRLFVEIGTILKTLNVNQSAMDLVISGIDDFMEFLSANSLKFFPLIGEKVEKEAFRST